MSKIKSLHITPFVFKTGKRGGGERYVQQLCASLEEVGVEVSLVECKNFFGFRIFGEAGKALESHNFFRLLSHTKCFDVIHVHQLNRETFTVAFFLSKLARIPLVLTDHGGTSRNLFRLFGKLRLKGLSAILAVSPWSMHDIDPNGVVIVNKVIWGGGEHIGVGGTHNFAHRDFLFLGRLLPHKGAHIVIEALPENASLVVAGERLDKEYFERLTILAQGKKVDFIEPPDDSALTDLYKSVKTFLIPSVNTFENRTFARPELLGIVGLESLFAGTQILGSDLGGLGDLLRASGQTLVEPGNVSAWKLAMANAMTSSEASSKKPLFTWKYSAEKCLETYREILT